MSAYKYFDRSRSGIPLLWNCHPFKSISRLFWSHSESIPSILNRSPCTADNGPIRALHLFIFILYINLSTQQPPTPNPKRSFLPRTYIGDLDSHLISRAPNDVIQLWKSTRLLLMQDPEEKQGSRRLPITKKRQTSWTSNVARKGSKKQ